MPFRTRTRAPMAKLTYRDAGLDLDLVTVVVANLTPRKLGGLMSAGMVLSGGDTDILGLSTIDESVPPGTRVK